MPMTISNASEAGLADRALTAAVKLYDLLGLVEAEAAKLDGSHWYGDIPDTQNMREQLDSDIAEHRDALSRWDGDFAFTDIPAVDTAGLDESISKLEAASAELKALGEQMA